MLLPSGETVQGIDTIKIVKAIKERKMKQLRPRGVFTPVCFSLVQSEMVSLMAGLQTTVSLWSPTFVLRKWSRSGPKQQVSREVNFTFDCS